MKPTDIEEALLSSAADELLALVGEKDPFVHDPAAIEALQVRALGERFEARRRQVPVLERRAGDLGVDRVASVDDIVPLLFAHDTYKSYPDAFIRRGNWAGMLRWLDSLSTTRIDGVDIADVDGVDEFIEQVVRAGHRIFCTSGTSGKCSFLTQSPVDLGWLGRFIHAYWAFPDNPIPQTGDRPVFQLTPESGPARYVAQLEIKKAWAPPGQVYALPISYRVSDINRMGAIRRALVDGSATPDDIDAFQSESAKRAEAGAQGLRRLTEQILAHRHEPIMLSGSVGQFWQIRETALELGCQGGDFHGGATIQYGSKELGDLPEDAMEQLTQFFSGTRWYRYYGMTEMSATMPACEAGNYHRPPWLVVMLLDDAGERLLPMGPGRVVGRAAYFDLSLDGRWAGLITGDRITVEHGTCECGRPGPVIVPPVVRYADLGGGGDDKLTCGGTIESYLRGFIDAER